MVYIHPKQCLALRIIAVNEWERCEQELWGNEVSVEVLKSRIEKLEYERDTFRAENEKLRSGNNEAYVFGLHKGKEAAFIDYDIDGLRAEIKVLRVELEKTKRFYIEAGFELRQLREDNKRLRAALKPFADLSSHWEGDKMPLEPKTIIIDPLPVLYAVKETRND